MFEDARAKLLIQPEVGALSEQVQIKIRQRQGDSGTDRRFRRFADGGRPTLAG